MNSNKIDPRIHIGETHGIYTIIDVLDEKDKYGHYVYKSVCNECGFEKLSHYGAISGKNSIRTQCNHLRANGDTIKYGFVWSNKRIGNIFGNILARCYNKNDKSYRWYGQKGVTVCQEWIDNPILFEEWSLNNGYDDNLTIDRIDSDKNYCPDNCRWVTLEENVRRAGHVNWITVGDETLTGLQWSTKLGIGKNAINKAVRRLGIDKTIELIEAMLKTPPQTKNKKYNQSWFDVYGIQV